MQFILLYFALNAATYDVCKACNGQTGDWPNIEYTFIDFYMNAHGNQNCCSFDFNFFFSIHFLQCIKNYIHVLIKLIIITAILMSNETLILSCSNAAYG